MRIGVISDLHIDLRPDGNKAAEVLAREIANQNVEALLIAGDISGLYERSLSFIKELKAITQAKVCFCLGNHDIWAKEAPGITIDEVVRKCKAAEPESFLHNDAVRLTDHTVLVAGLGWYDYSCADPMFSYEDMERQTYMGHTWNTKKYGLHPDTTDPELCRLWNDALLSKIRAYPDDDVILMTHMVNHPSFLVGEEHKNYELFRYYNGYMGNRGLFAIAKEPNVKVAVSGHVHFRRTLYENGKLYLCPNAGIPSEFRFVVAGNENEETPEEMAVQFHDAFRTFEVR